MGFFEALAISLGILGITLMVVFMVIYLIEILGKWVNEKWVNEHVVAIIIVLLCVAGMVYLFMRS